MTAAVVGLGTACFLLVNLSAVERAMARAPAPDDGEPRLAAVDEPPPAQAGGGARRRRHRARSAFRGRVAAAAGLDAPQRLRRRGPAVPPRRRLLRVLAAALPAGRTLAARDDRAGGHRLARRLRRGRRVPQGAQSRGAARGADARARRSPHCSLPSSRGGSGSSSSRSRCHTTPSTPGATHTDVTVRLPALRVLTIVALTGAALCLYASVRRVPIVAAGVLRAGRAARVRARRATCRSSSSASRSSPRRSSRERPHVADGIAFTRRAYGLDRVEGALAAGRLRALAPRASRARGGPSTTCRSGTRTSCGRR